MSGQGPPNPLQRPGAQRPPPRQPIPRPGTPGQPIQMPVAHGQPIQRPVAPGQMRGQMAPPQMPLTSRPTRPVVGQAPRAPSHLQPQAPGAANVPRPMPSNVPQSPTKMPMARPAMPQASARPRGQTPPIQAMGAMSIASSYDRDIPKTYKGTSGSPTCVTANYLRLKVIGDQEVAEYEVLFNPTVDNREERFGLLARIEPVSRNKVFDGVKLFLPKALNPVTQTFAVETTSGMSVNVTLKYKKKFLFEDREAVQLFNILFNRVMRSLKLTQHRRNYYNQAGAKLIPQYNLQVWPGYAVAIDRYEDGILLQCDVSHRVLRTETVKDLLNSLVQKGGNWRSEVEKALLGFSVLTRYNNKTYIIDEFDPLTTPMSTFQQANGEKISFVDYYKRQYNINIMDKDQPMLIHRPRKKQEGEGDKVIMLVPELCLLTGMTDAMRSDFKIMRELANITRQNPTKRQSDIKEFVRTVNGNPEALSQLTTWGLQLCEAPVEITARLLEPESLYFGSNYVERVNAKGDWTRAAVSREVLGPVNLTKWAVFYPSVLANDVKKFCNFIQATGKKMGIQVANPKPVELPNDNSRTYTDAVSKTIVESKNQCQLVLVVFPRQRGDLYSALKKLCCIQMPTPSQCILAKTIKGDDRKTQSVAQKVLLQMNCKLGGELWATRIPIRHLMVIGIDVFHKKSDKSVGGVVASLNPGMSRFYSETAVHGQGEEMLVSLGNAVRNSILKFIELTNVLPEHVVVFRDGVGDGQLPTVEKSEADEMLSIFAKIVEEKNKEAEMKAKQSSSSGSGDNVKKYTVPSLNYVIVQKRINTRLYQQSPGSTNFENPPPGTIVDNTITRFNFKDFFLVPQCVNQGTVTPTHFVVVKEEGDCLKPNEVQKLAYKLTHMYFNWPGTVRVPAPCQYAHKLVELVGEVLRSPPVASSFGEKLYYL